MSPFTIALILIGIAIAYLVTFAIMGGNGPDTTESPDAVYPRIHGFNRATDTAPLDQPANEAVEV